MRGLSNRKIISEGHLQSSNGGIRKKKKKKKEMKSKNKTIKKMDTYRQSERRDQQLRKQMRGDSIHNTKRGTRLGGFGTTPAASASDAPRITTSLHLHTKKANTHLLL